VSVRKVAGAEVRFYPPSEGAVRGEVFEARVARVEQYVERSVVGDPLVVALIDLIPDVARGELPPLVEVTLAVDYLDEGGEALADAGITVSLVVDPRRVFTEAVARLDRNGAADGDLGWRGAEPEASGSEVDVRAFSRDANYEPSADEGDYG